MARATTCMLMGRGLGIDKALEMRDQRGSKQTLDFQCVECGGPVRAHKEGGGAQAHFEHRERNPNCQRSDPGR